MKFRRGRYAGLDQTVRGLVYWRMVTGLLKCMRCIVELHLCTGMAIEYASSGSDGYSQDLRHILQKFAKV